MLEMQRNLKMILFYNLLVQSSNFTKDKPEVQLREMKYVNQGQK